MAAAYLFDLTRNQPYVDGNKRTGLVAALVFLDLNGLPYTQEDDTLYELSIAVAEGTVGKGQVSARLRALFGH